MWAGRYFGFLARHLCLYARGETAGFHDVNGMNGVNEQCSVYYARPAGESPQLEMTWREGGVPCRTADPIKPRSETKR